MGYNEPMDFKAELKQAQARKTASNDMVYKLVFETNDVRVLDLGKLPSDTLFDVGVTLHDTNTQKEDKEKAHNVGI